MWIWMRRCAGTGGKFSGHVCFFSSFDWHLIEIWVVHCLHKLRKRNWVVQEEIFMQLKYTYTDYRDNWKLKFPRAWYWEDCQSEYSFEEQQRCSPRRNQIKQLSMKSIHKGTPDHDSHCTGDGSNPYYNWSKTCRGSTEFPQHRGIFPKEEFCINSLCRGGGDATQDSMNKFTWEMLYKYLKCETSLTQELSQT